MSKEEVERLVEGFELEDYKGYAAGGRARAASATLAHDGMYVKR